MPFHDLYGIRGYELVSAAKKAQDATGILLFPHDSDYHGGLYFRGESPDGEEVKLKNNYDSHHDEWAEETFKRWPLLLYIDEVDNMDRLDSLTTRIRSEFSDITRLNRLES